MAQDQVCAEIIITGIVQGVFYRNSTLEKAQSLGINGWVKNLADGSVEIIAIGSRYSLEQLISWCHEGPAQAKVEDVIVDWKIKYENFDTFKVIR